jgi:hypothetical protein
MSETNCSKAPNQPYANGQYTHNRMLVGFQALED